MIQSVAIPKRRSPFAPATSPDVWWSMGEASGNDRLDSANSYDLSETGGTVDSAAGKVGDGALYGAGPYLRRLSSALPNHSADFTWCGWTKMTGTVGDPYSFRGEMLFLFSENVSYPSMLRLGVTETYGWIVEQNPGGGTGLAENFIHPVMPVSGDWYFWAITYNQTTGRIQFYLNGDKVIDTVCANVFIASQWDYICAVGSGAEDWDIVADEYARFPAVLSAAEILWLYNGGAGRAFADL